MHQSKLLVAVSLLLVPCAPSADKKHKQPMSRHEKGKFLAFAYTSQGLTAEGRRPVAGTTIAADPEVLPIGSRVRISGAGPWSGEYRVGDVGSAIRGRKVDIFVPDRKEAVSFGRKEVTIAVLHLPEKRAGFRTQSEKIPVAAQTQASARLGRDMITRDEARRARRNMGLSMESRGGSETRGTRSVAGENNSWESGGFAAFARLSSFPGTPAY